MRSPGTDLKKWGRHLIIGSGRNSNGCFWGTRDILGVQPVSAAGAVEELQQGADDLLYPAKKQGKARYVTGRMEAGCASFFSRM